MPSPFSSSSKGAGKLAENSHPILGCQKDNPPGVEEDLQLRENIAGSPCDISHSQIGESKRKFEGWQAEGDADLVHEEKTVRVCVKWLYGLLLLVPPLPEKPCLG
jgi:hypothetical protein